MTGGTDEAAEINRDLARAAGELGLGFGVGSQRAMALHPELEATFRVRDAAPDVFLIGNLGVVQARQFGVDRVAALAERIGADAMAIHLNPAMEVIQDDGDRDFGGALATIEQLVQRLPIPVIAKETGCGLSPQAARALAGVGVRAVDVSAAGGTSWVAVEARRAAPDSDAAALGEELWDWGIPTAVSTAACARAGLETIATGGLRTGLDVARALALGATAGGLAAPVLRAHRDGGYAGAHRYLRRVVQSIRTVALLCGCSAASELATAPRHLGPELSGWLRDLGLAP
jgi:isopentenyl-diphosphate delta-isomerase